MGILDIFKKRGSIENPSTSLADANIWGQTFSYTAAGVVVTEEKALTFPAYYRALKLLSETIAQLPIKVYKITPEGKEEDKDHPLSRLLAHEPNSWQTSLQFFETLQVNAAQSGNGIAKIIRNRQSGEVTRLELLDPNEIDKAEVKNGVYYLIFKDGSTERGENLIHIMNYTSTGLLGKGWLETAKEVIGTAIAENNYSGGVFKNGGNLSGILTTEKTLNAEAQLKLAKQWRANYSGSSNSHKTAILQDGMKYQQLSITPEEAQLINSKRLTIEDMSRVSGIPAHLLGDNSRSTFNNIEQQSLEFVQYTILPWVRKYEQELEKKLLFEREKESYQIRFVVDGLLRGDVESRGNFYAAMVDRGILTRNEVRKLENRNTLEGLDAPLTPLNMSEQGTEQNENDENE